jgi:hypothetical protein
MCETGQIEDFVKAVMDNPPRGWEVSGDIETWSTQWATEIMPLADGVITRVKIGEPAQVQERQGLKCTWPVTLSREYTHWANQQAVNQLGKAGFRLAALLRVIFEHR